MPTTTNYGWTTPADTDLVKDGAAAIRTLGNSVDTTTKNLNPETTLGDIAYRSSTSNTNTRLPIGTSGQVLTVVAGVPAWSSETGDISEVQAGTGISVASGTGPIPIVTNTVATAFDAKGDLIAGTGADAFLKLTVGANDTVLTADSSTATGLKWAAAATGGANWSLLNAGGTALTGASTITVSGISNKSQIMVLVASASSASAGANIRLRLNADTGSNYYVFGRYDAYNSTYAASNGDAYDGLALAYIDLGKMSANAGSTVTAGALITGCSSAGVKMVQNTGAAIASGSSGQVAITTHCYYDSSSTISSISIVSSTGNLDSGTVYVYTTA